MSEPWSDTIVVRGQPVRYASPRRRGGVYVLVLGAATMLAVVGLGAIAVSRVGIRSAAEARDWAHASVLAESAVETGLALMNTSNTWRVDRAAGDTVTINSGSRRSLAYRITDPVDGDLVKGTTDPVLLYGSGRVGAATRAFSVECRYVPPPILDVLRYGLYCSATVNAEAATVSGAPLGAATLNNTAFLTADVRVGTLMNSGTIAGEVRTGEVGLSSLSDGSFPALTSSAQPISYDSLSGNRIYRCLLSAGNNPYGPTNPRGVYRIVVPTSKRLRIHECRIAATLIIELALDSELEIKNEINWDRPSSDLPTLVIVRSSLSSVTISGTSSPLTESGINMNLNPAHTPYEGQSDSDLVDSYPSEIRGVIHIRGSLGTVNLGPTMRVVGTVICESSANLRTGTVITHDPQLLIDPPTAYQAGPSGMAPVAGTWRWQVE